MAARFTYAVAMVIAVSLWVNADPIPLGESSNPLGGIPVGPLSQNLGPGGSKLPNGQSQLSGLAAGKDVTGSNGANALGENQPGVGMLSHLGEGFSEDGGAEDDPSGQEGNSGASPGAENPSTSGGDAETGNSGDTNGPQAESLSMLSNPGGKGASGTEHEVGGVRSLSLPSDKNPAENVQNTGGVPVKTLALPSGTGGKQVTDLNQEKIKTLLRSSNTGTGGTDGSVKSLSLASEYAGEEEKGKSYEGKVKKVKKEEEKQYEGKGKEEKEEYAEESGQVPESYLKTAQTYHSGSSEDYSGSDDIQRKLSGNDRYFGKNTGILTSKLFHKDLSRHSGREEDHHRSSKGSKYRKGRRKEKRRKKARKNRKQKKYREESRSGSGSYGN